MRMADRLEYPRHVIGKDRGMAGIGVVNADQGYIAACQLKQLRVFKVTALDEYPVKVAVAAVFQVTDPALPHGVVHQHQVISFCLHVDPEAFQNGDKELVQ